MVLPGFSGFRRHSPSVGAAALLLALTTLAGCATLSTPRAGLFPATRAEANEIAHPSPEGAPPCPHFVVCLLDLPISLGFDLLLLPLDAVGLLWEHRTPDDENRGRGYTSSTPY